MQAEPLLSLAVTVAGEHSVEGVLDNIVKGLASQPGIALARVWLLMPGDLCGSCFMRSECRDQTQCLHLVASAGTPNKSPSEDWSFLQGHFRRVPLNARKTGVIGATKCHRKCILGRGAVQSSHAQNSPVRAPPFRRSA